MSGEEIYGLVRGERWRLLRDLGPEDWEDALHDAWVVAAGALARTDIDIGCPAAYVKGIVAMLVRMTIRTRIHHRASLQPEDLNPEGWWAADAAPGPEALAIAAECERRARIVLGAMPGKDREIVERFYLLGQDAETIKSEMGLTETQFRLRKSRARHMAMRMYKSGRGPGRKRLAA